MLPETVRKLRNQLGAYQYPSNPKYKSTNLELRPLITFDNGDVYLGEWNKLTDKIEGKGLCFQRIGTLFEGYWLDHKAEGPIRIIYENGDVYEGDFKDKRYHGNGKYTYASGAEYEGEWLNGK